MNTGIYVETLPPETLLEPDVRKLLSEYQCDVGMGFALPYRTIDGPDAAYYDRYLKAVEALRGDGVQLFLWPLARKEDGYWLNERNVALFRSGLERFADYAAKNGVSLPGFIYDIETPWAQSAWIEPVKKNPAMAPIAALRMLAANRNPFRFRKASREMTAMLESLRDRVETSFTAVIPFCMEDLVSGGYALQDVLETPVFSVPWDHYNVMIYNSYIPVWFSFAMDRMGAARLIYEYGIELKAARGDAAAFTFGSTWEGVLADNQENIFRDPADLKPDIAAAKAAGVDTMWLYCLEGVLYEDFKLTARRRPSDSAAWLEVYRTTAPEEPEPSAKLTRFRNLMRVATFDPLSWIVNMGER